MASGRMEFNTVSLMRHSDFSFVLPDKVQMREIIDPRHYDREPVNIILLHGLTGTDTDWMHGGNAHELSKQYNLNVFMPTAGNSFFLDRGYPGGNYATYIAEELPDFINRTFRIGMRRDNTIIGGLSMGGFGALHLALSRPERFYACIALSSALVVDNYMEGEPKPGDPLPPGMAKEVFGDPSTLKGSDRDLPAQYRKLKEGGSDIPRIYMAVGTEDPLLIPNRKFVSELESMGADLIYEEGPGSHNWYFWKEYIKKGLDALL